MLSISSIYFALLLLALINAARDSSLKESLTSALVKAPDRLEIALPMQKG